MCELTGVLLPLTYTVKEGIIGVLSPSSSWGRDGERVHHPRDLPDPWVTNRRLSPSQVRTCQDGCL